jgi:hypothetical protein
MKIMLAAACVLALLLALAGVAAAGPSSPPLTLWVHPQTVGTDDLEAAAGLSEATPLRSLSAAQQKLRAALLEQPQRDVVIELLPGSHRVPSGGLLLTAEDSPPPGSTVTWRGRGGDGSAGAAPLASTAVSGGEPVTGWTAVSDPTLPKGVMAAAAPALPSGGARHLYVEGVRASRTRVNASLVLPGGKRDKYGAALPNLAIESQKIDKQEHADAYATPLALNWSNPIDVEFVYTAGMAEPRCSVSQLERNASANKTSIVIKQPCMWNLLNRDWGPVTTPPVWIENLREVRKTASFCAIYIQERHFAKTGSGQKYRESTQKRVPFFAGAECPRPILLRPYA